MNQFFISRHYDRIIVFYTDFLALRRLAEKKD